MNKFLKKILIYINMLLKIILFNYNKIYILFHLKK